MFINSYLKVLFRLYLLGCFSFLLVTTFDDFNIEKFNKLQEISEKLPNYNDLTKYIDALHRIIDFCNNHRNDIDLNLYFGLFLANVTLKRVQMDKHRIIPEKLNVRVTEIIRKLATLMDFFSDMVKQDNDPRYKKYKIIFNLFANSTMWIRRLPQLRLMNLNKSFSNSDNEKIYRKWTINMLRIDDVNVWVPSPQQSDICLASLASAKKMRMGREQRCEVLKLCYDMLRHGSDFGYALAHRLLFLQQARFGRGCYIFSEQEDEILTRRFCSIAYQEAINIAWNDFAAIDLLLEHVCLCALDGYAQFLHRSWLTNILYFQTQRGCFTQNIHDRKSSSKVQSSVWKLAKSRDQDIMGGYCNGHTTALAAGTLAMAIRFIIESQFVC